ncbi:hypothetical protein CEXT_164931 [Caerostris extrusa]|uniref:Uncharacterized protein n=1 Tax=Caerostris extrusa TaxID=172846 RepID=A0AAV4TE18_CAEEX|nr:hypothetical protein CEXT_164931 [Caerostris extrusa]
MFELQPSRLNSCASTQQGVVPWETDVPLPVVSSLGLSGSTSQLPVSDVTPLVMLPGVALVAVAVDPPLEAEAEVPDDPVTSLQLIPVYHSYQFPKFQLLLSTWSYLLE